MVVTHTIAVCRRERAPMGKLALVPTMGALHAGHIALIKIAKKHAPKVAVSIFVNPTQFGPGEDFSRYPRPLEDDLEMCRRAGVDLVFCPSASEMYPAGATEIVFDLPQLSGVLEGEKRPGHFRGVCQVVGKLFNILQPEAACFGEKDYQQLRILTAMVAELNWPIEIIACPTLRDPDGLAISSRNRYLTPPQRTRALAISRGLMLARREFESGEKSAKALTDIARGVLLEDKTVPVAIDYVAAVDALTLAEVKMISAPAVIAVAVKIGTTRLIDNVILKP